MRRVLIRRPGGYSRLEVVEEPDPSPGPGQVRVRVEACGVNFADCIARMGYYEAARGLYPLTPGFEFAGATDDGRRVLGVTRFGGYSDRIVAEEGALWPCPEGWSAAECAAFPAVHLTAWYGLTVVAGVCPGETVLVHSAAGGAGAALAQLALARGCRVVGVVGSPHKAAYVRELGVQAVIDRSAGRLWEEARAHAPGGYDAVFDANGVSTPRPGFAALAPGGRLVVYGFAEVFRVGPGGRPNPLALAWNALRVPRFSPLEMTGSNRAVLGFNVVHLFHRRELLARAMEELLALAASGRLRKAPLTLFPLERAAEAHRALESGGTVGKLVLTA